jgi:hypothetical protein
VRLGLTLDYVEQSPHRALAGCAARAAARRCDPDHLHPAQTERWQGCDSAVILAGLLGVLIVLVVLE